MTPEEKPIGRQNRKRFVISLEQQPAGKRSTKRGGRLWPKVLAAVGIIVVLLAGTAAAAGFLWWRNYQTTPAYSLALLVDAVQRKDAVTVNEIVDIDKIVDSVASDVTEKSVSRYGSTISPQQRKRVEALVPALLPGVKQNIRDSLVKRLQEISNESEPKPFIILALGIPYRVKITTESDSAKAIAPAQGRDIELIMQRNSERWRIVGIKDETVIPQIVDDIVKDFPAIGPLR